MPKNERKTIGGTGQRLRLIRKQFQLTREEMSARLGIKIKSYYKNENNETLPSFKSLHRLQKDFDVSMDWFIFNKGPMFLKEKQAEINTEKVETKVENISPELQGLMDEMEQDPRLRHEIFIMDP